MYDNYNYPPGADNPSAPWNEKEPKTREFNVLASQTLSKETKVTAAYNETKEWDGENEVYEVDTSDINWREEYANSGHSTPLELLVIFKKHLETLLKEGNTQGKTRWYKHLIAECDSWVEDETIIEEA